jgi:hypothetical protein
VDVKTDVGDLSALFRKDACNADRVRAVRDFGMTVRARLQGVSSGAGRGTQLMTERSVQLLAEVAARLPIRTAETLRRENGTDSEAQARHVIDEAARLAGWLWTGAAAVPARPVVVHAVKVVLHSAIEIRMVGELYTIHGDAATDRNRIWLGTILLAWANGQPVAPGATIDSGMAVLVNSIRQSVTELVRNDSRFAAIANRGREGSAVVRRLGCRMHRRMRLHPSTWTRPDAESTRDITVGLVAEQIRSSVPESVMGPSGRGGQARSGRDWAPRAALAGPHVALAQAWTLHRQASAAVAGLSTSDPVAARLRAALAAQAAHLDGLDRRLGQARQPVRAQRGGADLVLASESAWHAEDAIDAAEETGARPRRLSSRSSRGRAALVYLLTALVVSATLGAALWSSSGAALLALLAVQSLLLPWVTLAIGAIVIGPLFRPWLGGPVPRHPVAGALVALGIHLAVGVLVTGSSTLL